MTWRTPAALLVALVALAGGGLYATGRSSAAAAGTLRPAEQPSDREASPPIISPAPPSDGQDRAEGAAIEAAEPATTATPSAADAAPRGGPYDRFEALERAVARGETAILPGLRATRLDDDPSMAGPIVRAVGHLATAASAEERDASARTLGRWLREERGKGTTFAKGNVSLIVDALADSGSSTAWEPLVEALDAGDLPLHAETNVVNALSALGETRARPALSRFADRVARRGTALDTFERELIAEAELAVRSALARLDAM